MINQDTCDHAEAAWGDLPPEEQSDTETLLRTVLATLRATNRKIGYVQRRAHNMEPKDPRVDRFMAGEDMAAAFAATH